MTLLSVVTTIPHATPERPPILGSAFQLIDGAVGPAQPAAELASEIGHQLDGERGVTRT
jgi:hypothetical protein